MSLNSSWKSIPSLLMLPRAAPIVLLKDEQRKLVPDKEAKEADGELQQGDFPREAVLLEGPAPDEPEVEQGEVCRLDEDGGAFVGIDRCGGAEEAHPVEEEEGAGDKRVRLAVGRPGGDGGLEEAGAGVELWQAMARAGDEAEDLGRGVEEVEELGHEEEAERLGEVAEDADDGEDHAGEVAVGVSDEDAGGVPVVAEEGARDADPGEEQVEREEVGVGGRVRVGREKVEAVVEGDEQGDDEALGDFDAVDAGEHVDALRAEHGDAGHVGVVEGAEVEELAEQRLERQRDDDGGDVEVDKVDDEERDGGDARDPPLVAPADVEEVVADAEEGDGLEGDDGAEETAPLIRIPLHLNHHIAIPASARRRHDILVERKRDKHNHGDEIDGGAHGAHALGQLRAVDFAEVAPAEAGLDKGRAEPADHGVAEREGGEGEREGGDEGLAVAAEGVEEDGERGGGEGGQAEGFGAGEAGWGGGGGGGVGGG
ncbi:hypothetical protein CCMA1212_004231 [Trichoderma ghanense]|uniref:Uncharacterized protein n=1 Tax=Trichoderma ghanense TaxID=65468 RepID=A0ABY2H6C1_9HYPO